MNFSKNRLLIGIILILIAIFLGISTQYKSFDVSEFIFPGILMVIGLYSIIANSFKPFNVAILAIGIVLLVDKMNLPVFEPVVNNKVEENEIFKYIIIGIAGLGFIWSAFNSGYKKKVTVNADRNSIPDYFCIFGGVEAVNDSEIFTSAKVTAIFGGVDLDLRNAKMQGDDAYIEAFSLFGGSEITVPFDWKVEAKGLPIFGGAENKVKSHQGTKTLHINYIAIFGGMTIKD